MNDAIRLSPTETANYPNGFNEIAIGEYDIRHSPAHCGFFCRAAIRCALSGTGRVLSGGVQPTARLIRVFSGGTKGPRDRRACKGC